MNFLDNFWENLLHIDRILDLLIESYPFWSYFILGFTIFAETAFIVTSFLPSDVVLFAACSLMMVQKSFNPFILIPIFFVCAVLGDNLNFAIGRMLRKKVIKSGKVFFIKQQTLEKANIIFEKSGGTAIFCARFVPFLRSIIPFITGISKKEYNWFFKKNILSVALWTVLYCSLGVFFGNLNFVKNHFGVVALGIGCITIITAVISLFIRKIILERKQRN